MAHTTSPPPHASRPRFPDGYGIPDTDDGLLDWTQVRARLESSTQYWLATVRPDGCPHVVPRWGVWLDDRLYYDGAPSTRHARNLRSNPHCTLNLEDGNQAVIVEGTSAATRADADGLGARLAQAFTKYHDRGYSPGADSWAGEDGGGLCVFTPARAFAWFDYPNDATRFTF